LGGNPITDYAPDFWLVTTADGTRVGYITSPWWSPELDTNIALAYVPFELCEIGTELKAELPEPYAQSPGTAVDAVVCEVPFRPSVNPSARERAEARGRDYAD
jgi:aminomethyltransferase